MIIYRNAILIPKQDPDPEQYDASLEPEEGDELASDSFPCVKVDDVVYKFTLRNRTDKDSDNFDIGANQSQEEVAETTDTAETKGLDCVLNHRLEPVAIKNAKQFKLYIKKYGGEMKKVMAAKYTGEEAAARLGKIQKVFRFLLEDFDNCEFFSGEHYNQDGTLLMVHWDGAQPNGYLVIDGVGEEKQ
ncbi:translationally-controlled tumor protein homolog [Lineus longissimus]|uniref:translationally-controlled tumor protein homolog n=1 Tax=Lineus longissimus TaxID=88925 RepID=UPI002B4EC106